MAHLDGAEDQQAAAAWSAHWVQDQGVMWSGVEWLDPFTALVYRRCSASVQGG